MTTHGAAVPLLRKSRRIAHRTLTESDRWWDIQVALKDDCVEAFQTKIEFYEFDVNKTWVGWRFNYKQQNQIVALDWVGDRGIAIARKFRIKAPITRTVATLSLRVWCAARRGRLPRVTSWALRRCGTTRTASVPRCFLPKTMAAFG